MSHQNVVLFFVFQSKSFVFQILTNLFYTSGSLCPDTSSFSLEYGDKIFDLCATENNSEAIPLSRHTNLLSLYGIMVFWDNLLAVCLGKANIWPCSCNKLFRVSKLRDTQYPAVTANCLGNNF